MSEPSWQRYQERLCVVESLGFTLDTSRMNFPDGFLPGAAARMAPAFAAMAALEKGAVANPDEKRQVGHYWLRAPELAPEAATRQAIQKTQADIVAFAAAVHSGQAQPERGGTFRELLVIGIGGSALGPQLAAEALGTAADALKVHFIDNTDPDGIDRTLMRLAPQLGQTLTVVISKSGGTKETRNGMLEAMAAYRAAGLSFARHAVAVTGEGSELDRRASAERWLARFPMWDWVGGRTSQTSAVGLLPAALQGIDIAALLEGARTMDVATRVPNALGNPAALLALAWFHATGGKGAKDMVILPYKDRLLLLSKYLQQLVMESLGKAGQGIAVYGNKGSTDQHAYVQQLREGVPNFFATFIEVLKDRAGPSLDVEPGITSGDYLVGFLLGTRAALFETGRESITLTVPDVSARTLGALIALYERAVGLYASLIGVNAYHQPGVEAGKKAADRVIALEQALVRALAAAPGPLSAPALAERAGASAEGETAFKILEHLAANPGRGVARHAGASYVQALFSKA